MRTKPHRRPRKNWERWNTLVRNGGYECAWIKWHPTHGQIEIIQNSREPAIFLHVVYAKAPYENRQVLKK